MTGSVRLDLGVPLQRFSVTVQHSTPRVPNPLEAALIHIVLRLGALPHYQNRTLLSLFTEMLCIPQAELWLAPVLEELVDIRLLTGRRPLDDVAAITLGDLVLTERGQKMISNGKLLGRPQRTSVTWCWDPVTLEVRNPLQWERLSRQAPTLVLPAAAYTDVFPIESFRASLDKEAWYRPGETEVEDIVVTRGPELAWESLALDLTFSGARLVCSTTRPAVRQYLQEQNDPLFTAQLASAVFGPGYADLDGWPHLALGASDRFLTLPQMAQGLGRARELAFDTAALTEFDGIEVGPAGGLRVYYADTNASDDVDYSGEHGHHIITGRRLPAADCNIVSDGHGWRLCRIHVQIGQASVAVPVARQAPGNQAVADPVLAQALLSTGQDTMIAAALRLSATTVWPALLQVLRTTLQGKVCLDAVLTWMAEMAKLDSAAFQKIDRHALRDMLMAALHEHGRFNSPAELTDWRIAMQALALPDTQPVLGRLLEAAYPATSIRVLHSMTDEARKVSKDYCIPYGAASYAASLVAELLALNSLEQVERALRNPNPFEQGLRALWKNGASLARSLGTDFPVRPPAPTTLSKILRERKSETCLQAIRDWRDALRSFYELAQVTNPDPANPLHTTDANLAEWEEQLSCSAASGAAHFDYVFVVDTNALINMPQLPLKMTGNVLLVVPLTVLQELDRKKQDPALRKACSVAVQLLRGMQDQRRRYEESDLKRLPPDFEDTADNRILSVAMKYHHPNLRLVTNDKILMEAAESMNIIAVPLERFTNAPVARAKTSTQAHKKQQHKKGAPV